MKKFYVTFGQQHPCHNGWIEVFAANSSEARELVLAKFGTAWSMLYDEDHFKPKYFPEGCKGTIK